MGRFAPNWLDLGSCATTDHTYLGLPNQISHLPSVPSQAIELDCSIRAFGPANAPLIEAMRSLQPRHSAIADNVGVHILVREKLSAIKPEATNATALWRGVIARTIQDWLSKPLRPKREAERYLFENSLDLSSVCDSAGINVERLRTCLNKVRGRTLLDLLPVAK